MVTSTQSFEEASFVLYSSYYILYTISKLAQKRHILFKYENIDRIWPLYSEALSLVKAITKQERNAATARREKFNEAVFFKTNKPKKLLDQNLG